MHIQKNISLKPFNTFGIDVSAKYFYEINSVDEFEDLLVNPVARSENKIVLGGGSNVLFTKDFNGLVIRNNIGGIKIVKEDNESILVQSGAGIIWHELVLWSIQKNLGGIENLSLIPGLVGAGPIQNIGAYGAELKNVFHELDAVMMESGEIKTFSKDDCKFGYRDSIFKNELRNKFIITSITLQLKKHPVFNTSYGAIESELKNMGVDKLSVKGISDAVIRIRQSKLPDPAKIGNAGSFFKNPTVNSSQFEELKNDFPQIIAYPSSSADRAGERKVKLAAGWLIEQCGWKGTVVGNTGSHKDQALVLVNYGNATGNEIFELAKKIQHSVNEKFGVQIETEVNII
ncbi:MAG: UDP-N-acetylmuramate dehydrogenase [Bacteroidia bacterium]